MSTANLTYVRERELLEAELGDELVALDVEDGLCFSFNEVATAIWQRLAVPVDTTTLVDELTDIYDVTREECRADVVLALEILRKHRLVRTI